MAQITNHKKVNIADLQREINLLRSFVVGYVKKDKEGKYRQKFIKDSFRAIREKAEYAFENKISFLNHLR
jgi:hypothetical protein